MAGKAVFVEKQKLMLQANEQYTQDHRNTTAESSPAVKVILVIDTSCQIHLSGNGDVICFRTDYCPQICSSNTENMTVTK